MVLMNAAKSARHQGSLINRPNFGGSAKKQGLIRSIEHFGSKGNPSSMKKNKLEPERNYSLTGGGLTQLRRGSYNATHHGVGV
jgi:hypothetical protein